VDFGELDFSGLDFSGRVFLETDNPRPPKTSRGDRVTGQEDASFLVFAFRETVLRWRHHGASSAGHRGLRV
jgi:hypothetical protein